MSRLSSLLVRDRVVEVGTMERAFRRKDLEGGRLGTILLELGAVDEEVFQRYLGEVVALPVPTAEMLASIDDEVLGELDVRDALAYGVLPSALVGDRLQVLVRDKLDSETTAILEERVGRPLEQYVLAEFRFEHALAELYGVRPSPRASALIERFPAKIGRSGMTGQHAVVGDDDGASPTPAAAILKRLGTRWTSDQLHRFLAHCESRDDIVQALLGFARNHFPRAFVLAVTQGRLRGFASKGAGLRMEQLREVALTNSRLLKRARAKGNETVFEGLAPDLGVSELYDDLEIDRPLEVACFVLRVGSRPAMFLLGDNEQKPVARNALPAVEAAVNQAAASLIRLIRGQKRAQRLSGGHTAPRQVVRGDELPAEPVDRALATLDDGWDFPTEVDLAPVSVADHPLVGEEPALGRVLSDTDPARPQAIVSSGEHPALGAASRAEEADDDGEELDHLMFGEIERLVMEEQDDDEVEEPKPTLLGFGGVEGQAPAAELAGVERMATGEGEPPAAIEQVGVEDDDSPEALVDALVSDNETRAVSARASLFLGEAPVLEAFTARFPGPVRRNAEALRPDQPIDAIGPFFPVVRELGQQYLATLHQLTTDPDDHRRLYATIALRDVRHADNVAVLGEGLFDDEAAVRRVAASVLGTYAEERAYGAVLQQLRRNLAHSNEQRRLAACEAAAALRDVASVPAIIERLDDDFDSVVESARDALERLTFQTFPNARRWRRWHKKHGGESRARWLLAGATHRRIQVRELVRDALDRVPDLDVDYEPSAGRRELKRATARLADFFKSTGSAP